METRRIRLREVQKEDLPTLFTWRNTEQFRFLFHHNEKIISYEEFCEEFYNDATVRKFQYVVEKVKSYEVVGLTFIHSFSEFDNHCFLNLFFCERFERKGYGIDAFILFSLFLFNDVGVRKIYVEAFAYNTYSIACIRRSGMVEIEALQNKKLHNGEEYDILRFVGDRTIIPKLKKIEEILTSPKLH